MQSNTNTLDREGLIAALAAYLIWGLLPLYLLLVRTVPPFEFVAWRIIWTLPLCLLIVSTRKQFGQLAAAITNSRTMLVLLCSSILIGINWVGYIWAIQNDHVYAASLGYYINPLVNVLLGTFFLGERLSRPQWVAVAIAACGVGLLALGALTTLWISLTLAFSFGTYGLLRKRLDIGSVPGLTIESALLLLPSTAVTIWYAAQPAGSAFGHDLRMSLLIMLGGVLTATPLLFFTIAAKRLPYSVLGFVQFLAPTIVFILGMTVFKEPLQPVQLACFALIWTALVIFVGDMWRKSRKQRSEAKAA